MLLCMILFGRVPAFIFTAFFCSLLVPHAHNVHLAARFQFDARDNPAPGPDIKFRGRTLPQLWDGSGLWSPCLHLFPVLSDSAPGLQTSCVGYRRPTRLTLSLWSIEPHPQECTPYMCIWMTALHLLLLSLLLLFYFILFFCAHTSLNTLPECLLSFFVTWLIVEGFVYFFFPVEGWHGKWMIWSLYTVLWWNIYEK